MAERKQKTMLIGAALVLIALVLWVAWTFPGADGREAIKAAGLSIDPNAQNWSASIPSDGKNGIQIPGYGDIYFPANQKTVPITLYNPGGNDCLFAFSLYINGQGPCATTELIAPGTAVTQVMLDNSLEAGEYDLEIKVDTFEKESCAPMNNAVVETKLIVQ